MRQCLPTNTIRSSASLIPLVALFLAGCGNPDRYGREAMEGTVNFRGQPLTNANIYFVPEGGSAEFRGDGTVLNGRYQIDRDHGVPPGKYRVRVSALEPQKVMPPPPNNGLPGDEPPYTYKQLIPTAFCDEGVVVEVVAGKKNVFDIEIP